MNLKLTLEKSNRFISSDCLHLASSAIYNHIYIYIKKSCDSNITALFAIQGFCQLH